MTSPVVRALRPLTWAFCALALAGVVLGKDDVHRRNLAEAAVPTTTAVYGPRLPGAAVYPAQRIPLRFDHRLHLGKGMRCVDCHSSIGTSTRSSELNLPTGATCDRCHGPQHPKPVDTAAKCGLCHLHVDGERRTASLDMPRPLLRFNHRLHAQRGASCERCHGDMTKVRLATTLQLPSEASCLECHDGAAAPNTCGSCHPKEASGRLLTRTSDERTAPRLVPTGRSAWGVEHDLAFVEDHAGPAKANPELCKTCHDEASCLACHAGPTRPMRIHDGDYLTTHGMESRGRTQDCQACHRAQTFCLGCHERVGFGDRNASAFGVGSALRFHPEGWSGPAGAPQGHAQAAARNLSACVSCHTEDTCLSCHATERPGLGGTAGLGVSPHGPDFGSSPRCQALADRNRRVCLQCHAPTDMHLDCL